MRSRDEAGGVDTPAKRDFSQELLDQLGGAAPPAASDDGRGEIRAGAIVLVGFFGLFLGWAAFAPLDAAVVGNGVVVVSGSRQSVQHRDGGIVSRLAVQEGQRVEQGQVLLELSAPEVGARDSALLSQIVDLQMQRARLTAEIGGVRTLTAPPEWAELSPEDRAVAEEAFQRHTRESRALGRGGAWSEYDARIAGYRDEIASVRQQESLLQDELAGMRSLADRQLVPLTRVRALERALAELGGRRAALRATIATTQQERSELRRQVDARLAELTPQFAAARDQMERTKLRAPSSGVVVGLSAHTVGGVIGPGERIMDIVPEGRELIVEARIRPEDADDIRAGQTAEVHITAFSGRNFSLLDGTVQSVSADRFVDEATGVNYFIARVAVLPDQLENLAAREGARLRVGLPAQVVARTRKRTALQYLLEPLNQSIWRSFRET